MENSLSHAGLTAYYGRMDWQSCDGIVDHDTGQLTSILVDLPILPVGGEVEG